MKYLLQETLTKQIIAGLYNGVTSRELDILASELAAAMTTDHADYAVLAARISVSMIHKNTKSRFTGKLRYLTIPRKPN